MRFTHPSLPCLGAVAVAVACGTPGAAPTPAARADPCSVGDSLAPVRDTLRVALLESVDARHAPAPVNDDERLVFRQLYETLVRVDCVGRVRAGLAVRWHSEGDTLWTFGLRSGTRFWDGTPIDAATVLAGWRGSDGVALRTVRAGGDDAIVVTLGRPQPIEAFADPAWSVVKRIPESAWPLGTGPVWVQGWAPDAADSVLTALPIPGAPPTTPALIFRLLRNGDPRDLIDSGTDVMVTRDASTLRYAAVRQAWRAVPLAWDRLYAFLSPLRRDAHVTAQLGSDARAALARDAVRDEARAPPSDTGDNVWWTTVGCPAARGGPDHEFDERVPEVLAYVRDPVARDLATRLVARPSAELRVLLGGSPPTPVRAVSLGPPGAGTRLAGGALLGVVLSLPRRPLDPCRAIRRLTAAVPWLPDTAGMIPAAAVAPLVETRAHLLLRRISLARADAHGGVRLVP